MRSKNKKDFLSVAFGQFVTLGISIVRTLVIPLYLSVLNYGYFQSYLFYITLTPLFTIGYNDGIYLRYSKYDYGHLPFHLLSSSNWIYIFFQIILTFLILLFSILFIEDNNLKLVFVSAFSYSFFNSLNAIILQIYQITRRFTDFTKASITSKALSLVFIIILLLSGYDDFIGIIFADLLSFILITCFLIYKNIKLFQITYCSRLNFTEFFENIKFGFPLLISGLIGILYLGGGRLIVQYFGGIENFSYYSFSLSIASFVSVAISSVSLVVYPMIARYDKNALNLTYIKFNNILRCSLVGVILLYYISVFIITNFYKQYSGTVEYLSIVFVMMYYKCFLYVLQNTFYKTLQLQKFLLLDNSIGIICIFLMGIPIYFFTKSVYLVTLVTLFSLIIRYVISFKRLSRAMNINISYNYPEFLLIVAFMLLTSLMGPYSLYTLILLSLLIFFYVCLIRKILCQTIKVIFR